MCLHKVLGFGLPEEDSAVFASVLITPRKKEHWDVFRHFSSAGDWFYSIACLQMFIHFTMTALIPPTFSHGTKDNGSGIYNHVCKSPYWWDLHWADQKTRTLPTGKKKKYDCSFILIWKPSVLAHHQHQTAVLLCFSLWKVQPWTEATG